MSTIKVIHGKPAKTAMRALLNKSPLYGEYLAYAQQWLGETVNVACLMLHSNENYVAFVLLSKMDYDPEGIHDKPWTLNFVYTYPEFRNKGYGKMLLTEVKKRYQSNAHVLHESRTFFERSGFHHHHITNPQFAIIAKISGLRLYKFP